MSQRRSRLIFHAGNLDTRECAAKDGFLLASRRTCCWRSAFSWCSEKTLRKTLDDDWYWIAFAHILMKCGLASLRRPRPFSLKRCLSVERNSGDSIRQQKCLMNWNSLKGTFTRFEYWIIFHRHRPQWKYFQKEIIILDMGHVRRAVAFTLGGILFALLHTFIIDGRKKVKKKEFQSRHFSIFSTKSETGNWAKWTNWWKRAPNSRPKAGATHKCR